MTNNEALQALVTESQQNVTGRVRVKLYKGNVIAAGLKSPVSLYNPEIATMEADPTDAYNQDDATGFIRLNGLRLKVATKVANAAKKQPKKKTLLLKRLLVVISPFQMNLLDFCFTLLLSACLLYTSDAADE